MTLTDTQSAPQSVSQAPAEDESASVLRILLSMAILVAGWATSVVLWGIPGLYIPALAMVPVIWVLLLIISRG